MKYYFFVLLAINMLLISCNSTSFTKIQATLPDMNGMSDGDYRGNYSLSGTPVEVTLDVTVQNQKIIGINIVKHSRSPIGKKAERITGSVVEKQSLNVDEVSGATASSKAILKAIENALE